MKYQLTLDDHARKSWLQQLESKEFTLPAFQALQRKLENNKAPFRYAIMHSDSGIEYNDNKWKQYREANGIVHETSAPYR